MSESRSVLIAAVPPLAWGRGRDCPFAGALAAALEGVGQPRPYAELMGLAGLAFRIRWANADTRVPWCLSCPDGEAPDEIVALRQATGWQLHVDEHPVGQAHDCALARQRIVAALDGGEPVVGHGTTADMAVIYGYEHGGDLLLAREYGAGDQPVGIPYHRLGRMQVYLGGCAAPAPRRAAARAALELAVTHWYRERHDGGSEGREYWYGDAAWGAWLEDLDHLSDMPEVDAAACARLSAWNYQALKDARLAASRFLRTSASLFEPPLQTRLQRLGALYRRLAGRLHDGGWVPPGEVEQLSLVAVRRQQRSLAQARALEAEAVAEAESILADWATDAERRSRAAVTAGPVAAPAPVLEVHATGSGARLEGLEPRAWRNPAVGLATDVLRALGHPVDYAWLMGSSTAAFDLVFDWHSEVAWAPVLPEYLTRCAAGVGRLLRWPGRGGRWDAIVASVLGGRPAFCCQDGPGCVLGFETGERIASCCLYGQRGGTMVEAPVDEWSWSVGVLEEAAPATVDARRLARQVLQRVAWGADPQGRTPGQGLAVRVEVAYRRWIGELRRLEETGAVAGGTPGWSSVAMQRMRSLQAANALMYDRVADARLAASAFLRQVEPLLPEVGAAIGRAADLYEEIGGALHARREECLLGSWAPAGGAPSGAPGRRMQTATLEQVLRLERVAVAQLAGALEPQETSRE